jgi:hypothetical protein
MPSEPSSPESSLVGDDPRQAVLQKIEFVCGRLIPGQNATNCWEMKYYRVHTALTVILAVLGSAGLIKKQYDLTQMRVGDAMTAGDWAIFLAALLALICAVILELYRAFGIDKKALQAISAQDSFSRLRKALENALESADPRPELDQVVRDAKTLGVNFHDVLKEPDHAEVTRLKDKLVDQFQKNWTFPVAKRKGK